MGGAGQAADASLLAAQGRDALPSDASICHHQGSLMRIAIPSDTDAGLESTRAGHFGHAAYFTIVTVTDGKVDSVESVRNVDHDAVGCGGVIDFALGLDLDAIIATGMGRPPYMRFSQGGITVYAETSTPTVGGVVERYLAGQVEPMDPTAACNHH